LGQNPGPIDGVFGAQTDAAVRAFQQASGITVDGVVSTITWRNIDNTDLSEPELRNGAYQFAVFKAG
jgi:peptidoglycan hydrolase-like protein with peptidoglycan-binding domain